MKRFLCLLGIVLISGVSIAWVSTYDKSTPAGSDSPTVIDDRIRETKAAIQERENVDHYWPLTGDQVSEADTGIHRKVTILNTGGSPSAKANCIILYGKSVSNINQLFTIDEGSNEQQITYRSMFRAYLSVASNTIGNTTTTKVAFNTKSYDLANEFDNAVNNRFTVITTGYYLVEANLYWYTGVTANTSYQTLIYKNGAEIGIARVHSSSTDALSSKYSDILYLTAADYLEVYAYHNAGSNAAILGTVNYSNFTVKRVF